MILHDKIRKIRELNEWSQEDMAEKLEMSKNGYAKIERGESKLNLERLQQIATVLNIDVQELIAEERGLVCLISENSHFVGNANYYAHSESILIENEKLKLMVAHKDEILVQKEKEIQMLREMIDLMKQKS